MRKQIVAFALVLAGLSAHAESVQEIVVTGNRSDDYSEMPAVTLTKPADFLVQQVRLINDSRAPDLRRKEIIATIEEMLKRAATDRSIALSYGEGFIVPVDLSDDSLEIIEGRKRPDTSEVVIFVKIALARGDDAKARIADLRAFIERTRLTGRTEVEPVGDVGLSIVDPEKYRDEIIAKIAADSGRLARAIGSQCEIKVGGLSRRVEWERTEVAELMLYIPYEVEIAGCAGQ